MFYTTSNFNANLINAIVAHMMETGTKVLPLSFLASGKNGFPETSEIARTFMKKASWEYFYVKDNKLYVHGTYHWGKEGDHPFDYEVVDTPRPYPNNRNNTCIQTEDLIALVRITYDTIGNVHFYDSEVEHFDMTEINELEAEAEARRNEIA